MSPNPLPADTVETLRTERDAAHSVIAALEGELRRLRVERDLLQAQLQAAKRKLFAAKSEARGTEQRDLFLNEGDCPDSCVIGPYFPKEGCYGDQEGDCRRVAEGR